jgi:hypothetical protein
MKSNKETIKTYLEQEKTHGQSANVFFEYSKIYSYGYHYLLGKFLDDDLLIINDTGYSATTSKHIHLLRDTANQMNITNFSTSNVDLISVYNELKYLEGKLHKARKPHLWYNRINSLYNKWYNFTKKYGALLMIGREIKLSKIAQQSQRVKDIQKIMLRVEQYYTALTLNMSL